MIPRPVLLGFTIPDQTAAELFELDPSPAVQTHRFAWSLARSLRAAFGEVRLLSAAPVQSWPLAGRIVFRRRTFEQDGIDGVAVGFVNLIALKHLTRFFSALRETHTLLSRWRVDTVFIHGVHSPWLLYGRLLRMFGCRSVAVLTDPPGVILPTDGRLGRLLKRVDRWIIGQLVSQMSAVVALAPDLAADYRGSGPTLVFPGILGRQWLDQVELARRAPRPHGPLTVLYAGGVSAAYGVDRLIEAARLLPNVRFTILGRGDQVARIMSDQPSNVVYGGFVPPAELAPHVLEADILINPRPSDADFARNSFPSKLLEYAAAGRPVLTTRIRSIPDSLRPYFNYIDDESPEGIARAIQSLAETPAPDRLAAAERARTEVISEYSEDAVGRRLATLFTSPQA